MPPSTKPTGIIKQLDCSLLEVEAYPEIAIVGRVKEKGKHADRRILLPIDSNNIPYQIVGGVRDRKNAYELLGIVHRESAKTNKEPSYAFYDGENFSMEDFADIRRVVVDDIRRVLEWEAEHPTPGHRLLTRIGFGRLVKFNPELHYPIYPLEFGDIDTYNPIKVEYAGQILETVRHDGSI